MADKLKIHFIGIGGSSMNGLAQIMKNKGHEITGSDMAESMFTKQLEDEGINVIIGQKAENIKNPDIVVHTAAIADFNEELQEARKKGIPTIERGEFLGKITSEYSTAIGVAGCHGKTTVTSMIGLIAIKAGADPTVLIGASVPFFNGSGTHIGNSDTFILEACEYENSYHQFHLTSAVINNIDNDHLNFFGSIENIVKSFETFAKKLPENGTLFANADDKRVMGIAKNVSCNVQTYGINSGEWQARDIIHHDNGETVFSVYRNDELLSECHLNVPGEHNVQNALAAIAVCNSLGIKVEKSCEILKEYILTKRRFETYGKVGNMTLIHDYAHHPTEIAACINTGSKLAHNKLRGIFQSHTYSRTINHLEDFGEALSKLDEVIITDIYAAREVDEGKVHAKDIVKSVNDHGGNAIYIADFKGVKEYFEDKKDGNDILLAMGAGSIGEEVKILLD